MEAPVEKVVGDILRERGLRIAVAESCTGGLLGSMITDVPGSSDYFLGGVIAYSNEVKEKFLGVRAETLERFGAVSEPAAKEMADGVRSGLDADIGIAITGIAGPGGGSPEKPVGTVFVALATAGQTTVRRLALSGDRRTIREESAREALSMLKDFFKEGSL